VSVTFWICNWGGLINNGFVGGRLGWIFVASATLFFLLTMAASGVDIMAGKDWLVGGGMVVKNF
jgi:hypothetical protein